MVHLCARVTCGPVPQLVRRDAREGRSPAFATYDRINGGLATIDEKKRGIVRIRKDRTWVPYVVALQPQRRTISLAPFHVRFLVDPPSHCSSLRG